MFEELRLTALLQKNRAGSPAAFSAGEALNAVTAAGAAAIGLGGKTGKIIPGYLADLAIINVSQPHWQPFRNPVSQLVYASDRSDVETVIVNGKIVMKNRELITIDEERLFFEARRAGITLTGE
jgi:5-methylthioadenosine/S-adenosylhomocysteine deaminase